VQVIWHTGLTEMHINTGRFFTMISCVVLQFKYCTWFSVLFNEILPLRHDVWVYLPAIAGINLLL